MAESADRPSGQEESADFPYKDLYVYHLKGRLKPEPELSGIDFIGSWEEDGFTFLFFSRPSHRKVEAFLSSQPLLTLLDEYHMSYDEWHGGKVVPFRFGRFFISPPWIKSDSREQDLHIILDPGVVFGTGTHATTRDCLEALELACSSHSIESVLDLGTGTGLLALAAARLGCKYILAVDINLLAAKTAQRNIRLNQLDDKILTVQGRAEDFVDCHSDLVIANIHYDVMKNLLNSEGFLSKKWFVLSGLFRSQARDVAHKLSQYPAKIIKKWERDGVWHTFFCKMC
jgi:ribosomal protein L11 methyltransferase